MIGEIVVGEEGLHGSCAAAETKGINGKEGDFRIDVIPLVARRCEFVFEGLTHDHPERITGWRAMAARKHELIAPGVFGVAIVVAEAAEFGADQVSAATLKGV